MWRGSYSKEKVLSKTRVALLEKEYLFGLYVTKLPTTEQAKAIQGIPKSTTEANKISSKMALRSLRKVQIEGNCFILNQGLFYFNDLSFLQDFKTLKQLLKVF